MAGLCGVRPLPPRALLPQRRPAALLAAPVVFRRAFKRKGLAPRSSGVFCSAFLYAPLDASHRLSQVVAYLVWFPSCSFVVCATNKTATQLFPKGCAGMPSRAQKTNSSAPSTGAARASLGTSAPSGNHRVAISLLKLTFCISALTRGQALQLNPSGTCLRCRTSLVMSCASGTSRSLCTSRGAFAVPMRLSCLSETLAQLLRLDLVCACAPSRLCQGISLQRTAFAFVPAVAKPPAKCSATRSSFPRWTSSPAKPASATTDKL